MNALIYHFIDSFAHTSVLEYTAAGSGLASVWFSKRESIWVYPVGLIGTTIYIYLCLKAGLVGEATVNGYYTLMSIYGWWLWSKKKGNNPLVHVQYATSKQWVDQLLFFAAWYAGLYMALRLLQQNFYPNAIPGLDALASATAFTGMWLMAKKKVESWYWWMATNALSIPLYFYKSYVFTAFYYTVLLVFAFYGLQSWKKSAKQASNL